MTAARRPKPIYRKVFKRTWEDQRFKALSPPAKILYLAALTGPPTRGIPGLAVVHGGPPALASMAGLDVGPDDAARLWREIEESNLPIRADWPLLFSYEHFVDDLETGGTTPNSIEGTWARAWDEVPSGAFKAEVWEIIARHFAAYDERRREAARAPAQSYLEAFRDACERPARASSPEVFDVTG